MTDFEKHFSEIEEIGYTTVKQVISTEEVSKLKEAFLELGGTWWHESNRMIPIGIFLRQEMEKFRDVLMIMNTKDVSVKLGPVTSLANLAMKRSKRKSVQLVRKPK